MNFIIFEDLQAKRFSEYTATNLCYRKHINLYLIPTKKANTLLLLSKIVNI